MFLQISSNFRPLMEEFPYDDDENARLNVEFMDGFLLSFFETAGIAVTLSKPFRLWRAIKKFFNWKTTRGADRLFDRFIKFVSNVFRYQISWLMRQSNK